MCRNGAWSHLLFLSRWKLFFPHNTRDYTSTPTCPSFKIMTPIRPPPLPGSRQKHTAPPQRQAPLRSLSPSVSHWSRQEIKVSSRTFEGGGSVPKPCSPGPLQTRLCSSSLFASSSWLLSNCWGLNLGEAVEGSLSPFLCKWGWQQCCQVSLLPRCIELKYRLAL